MAVLLLYPIISTNEITNGNNINNANCSPANEVKNANNAIITTKHITSLPLNFFTKLSSILL